HDTGAGHDAGLGITVNGAARVMAPGATVADLVTSWCPSPEGIAVARNREVVPHSEWTTTPLAPRDVVEIVTAAAGG
ncbi:MAG: sulfur carrier protein ThiS, partial [Acidimicrobiales bacterium]|nr:sulfur carrier protein ThiS [Acidimicrobiales bacterium]